MSTSGFLTWDIGPSFCGSDRSADNNYIFPALYSAFTLAYHWLEAQTRRFNSMARIRQLTSVSNYMWTEKHPKHWCFTWNSANFITEYNVNLSNIKQNPLYSKEKTKWIPFLVLLISKVFNTGNGRIILFLCWPRLLAGTMSFPSSWKKEENQSPSFACSATRDCATQGFGNICRHLVDVYTLSVWFNLVPDISDPLLESTL